MAMRCRHRSWARSRSAEKLRRGPDMVQARRKECGLGTRVLLPLAMFAPVRAASVAHLAQVRATLEPTAVPCEAIVVVALERGAAQIFEAPHSVNWDSKATRIRHVSAGRGRLLAGWRCRLQARIDSTPLHSDQAVGPNQPPGDAPYIRKNPQFSRRLPTP